MKRLTFLAAAVVSAMSWRAAFAQASAFWVGGPAAHVEHEVAVASQSGQSLAYERRDTPDGVATVSVTEPGPANAFSATPISGASNSGVTVRAIVAAGASDNLRASAAAGQGSSIYYTFVLDAPAYVELHGVATYSHTSGSQFTQHFFGVSFSLRDSNGATISGSSFLHNGTNDPNFTDNGLHFYGLLAAGIYNLIGGVAGQVNESGSFALESSITLLINDQPGRKVVGHSCEAVGDVTVSRAGGAPQNIHAGDPIYMGDVLTTGSGSRACVLFTDDTPQLSLGAGTSIEIDQYLFDHEANRVRFRQGQGILMVVGSVTGIVANGALSEAVLGDYRFGIPMTPITEFISAHDDVTEIDEINLIQGQLNVTPWEGVAAVVDGPVRIRFDRTSILETTPLSQASYDALRQEFFPGNMDGDALGDGSDCAPSEPRAFAVPAEVTGLRLAPDKATLSWDSASATAGIGTVYDVVSGLLTNLPVGSGGESCIASGVRLVPPVVDMSSPEAGTGFWYLVRGRNVCGTGTYGTATNGIPRTTTACP